MIMGHARRGSPDAVVLGIPERPRFADADENPDFSYKIELGAYDASRYVLAR
jgi:hypothetical protein